MLGTGDIRQKEKMHRKEKKNSPKYTEDKQKKQKLSKIKTQKIDKHKTPKQNNNLAPQNTYSDGLCVCSHGICSLETYCRLAVRSK